MGKPLDIAAADHFQKGHILANKSQYGEELNWITPENAIMASRERSELLNDLETKALSGCLGTKLDFSNMSPGCLICAEGDWSCLFINNICNCDCFYCPTPQLTKDEPATNSLTFPDPHEYCDYIEQFGFRGVSISGGEPLLTPERTVKYLKAVKKRFGHSIYFWLYTNGTLATKAILEELRDAGLDEIRFDIGATENSLKMLKTAVGIIPRVTVEIPAVPEELELMKDKMEEMRDAGVSHLNMHQLRLTPYNLSKLSSRPYTFVPGEKVTVLESELTALKLLKHSLDENLGLPLNYCSFVFKNRFQRRAARRRAARAVIAGHEGISEDGFIRILKLNAIPENIDSLVANFNKKSVDNSLWRRESNDSLLFHHSLFEVLEGSGGRIFVDYHSASFVSNLSYRNPFREIKLDGGRKVAIERRLHKRDIEITSEDFSWLKKVLNGSPLAGNENINTDMAEFEFTLPGMQSYL